MQKMPERLAGKVCMVTGAGSGIGAAIARRFAAEGGRVFLLDRAIDNANKVAAGIGGAAETRQLDVRDAAQVKAAIAAVRDAAGRIDVLVNVAGITLLSDVR